MLRGWKEPYCRFPARSQGPGEWEDQGEHSLGLGEYERRELKSDMTGVSFPSRQSPKQQQALYNKSAQHRAAKCSGDRHSAMKKPEQKVLGQPSILSTHHHVCASCVAENGAGVTPRDWTIRGVLHPKYWIRDSMKTSISQDAAGEVTMSEKEIPPIPLPPAMQMPASEKSPGGWAQEKTKSTQVIWRVSASQHSSCI